MFGERASRREFIVTSLVGLGLGVASPSFAGTPALRPVRFGVCADVHQDIMHDAEARLRAFVSAMAEKKVDFVIQLGDFCQPKPENQGFMSIWNGYEGAKYHVPGNHDTDGGFTWEQMRAFYGMECSYYSFDVAGWHFVVLDGNEKSDPPVSGYPRHIGEAQMAWLKADLEQARGSCVLFSHQALHEAGGAGVDNAGMVRALLERINREAGYGKVAACIYGHRHIDEHREINGIHYLSINSMSDYWVGEKYVHQRFEPAIEEAHPWVRYTIPYQEPVYAVVTLRPEGKLLVEGRKSAFVPPGPAGLGHPLEDDLGASITPGIEDRTLDFKILPVDGVK